MADFFLQATDPRALRRTARRYCSAAAFCLVADVVCAAALLLSVHGGSLAALRPSALLDFHGDVADLALLSLLRLLLLPLVAAGSASVGRRRDSASTPPPAQRNSDAADGDSLTEPLLPVSVDAVDGASPAAAPLSVEALEASHRCDQARLARRNWLLALLFTLSTGCAVFVGVKVRPCVSAASLALRRVTRLLLRW